MNRSIAAAMTLAAAMIPRAAEAGQSYHGDMQSCLVEVLYSEELPVVFAFYHTYRTVLRVTAPDRPPFVTTVEREMPWQAPPPRLGQTLRLPCDSALLQSTFRLF